LTEFNTIHDDDDDHTVLWTKARIPLVASRHDTSRHAI